MRRAIFDAIRPYNVRPGEIFPLSGISVKLHDEGFRASEVNDELEAMEDEGLIEGSRSPAHAKITEAGFAAL